MKRRIAAATMVLATLVAGLGAETDWFAKVLATVRATERSFLLREDDDAVQLVSAEFERATASIGAELTAATAPPLDDRKAHAIAASLLALGELRRPSGVPALVKHLTWSGGGSLHPAIASPTTRLPVVALVRIGTPSLRPLLERVVTERDELTPVLAAAVILGVLGKRPGVVYLQDAVAAEPDAARRERLRMVTRSLQEYVDLPPPDLRWGPDGGPQPPR